MKKLLSVLLCLSFLLTAVACKKETPQEPETPSVYATYDDVVAEFTALLTAKHGGEELEAPNTEDMDERETAIAEALYNIVNTLDLDATYPSNLGYGYKDLDGNGTLELLLLSQYYSIRAIFTLSDGAPVLLEAVYDTAPDLYSSFIFIDDGLFSIGRTNIIEEPIREAVYYTCRVDGDQMVYDAVYGEVYDIEKKETLEYFEEVDGVRTTIDEATFNELYWKLKKIVDSSHYSQIEKLAVPYIHFPMNEPINTEDLPVADFSSYEAILETYRAISTCVDDFQYSSWLNGAYDNLFVFPDEKSFEYYNHLLSSDYRFNRNPGYDLIDLNGDGADELLILDEDYNIEVIFTQKDGVPVMWNTFFESTCWLDEKGLIHVDREEYQELEYSLYEFTEGGEFKLVYSILVTPLGRYLTRDGKTEKLPFEESLELYDEYCVYPEHMEPNEYTRDVSELTYTPMTPPTEDPVKAAAKETWYNWSKLEETTGKNSATGTTYVSFENVTDTQMDVNFKYKFTYYYPDPDHVSTVPGVTHVIPDTTESFLKVTAHKENGVFVFDENGIKGRIEFGQIYQWLIIEESTDERFPVGSHCLMKHEPIT